MLTNNQIHDFKKILDDRCFELREEIRLELLESDDQHYIDLAGHVRLDTKNSTLGEKRRHCKRVTNDPFWRILCF